MTTMTTMTTVPMLTGSLHGLKRLEAGDCERYKAAVNVGQQVGWSYYFPYLLAKAQSDRSAVLLAEDDDSLCVFQWRAEDRGPRLDLVFPPIPMNVGALGRALERANDFNRDRSARVLRIDDKDAQSVASLPSLAVAQRRMQYLFAPTTYESLAGSSHYTIRRNVQSFERLPDIAVTPFRPELAGACRALLSQWKDAHRTAHGTRGGTSTSKRAIALAGTLSETDLRGEVIRVSGRIVAFAFGGEIRPGLACSFERKCDTEIRGLGYFHFRSFLLSLRDFPLVNDGSDVVRAGLRQLKQSFRPVAMHPEHRATQRR